MNQPKSKAELRAMGMPSLADLVAVGVKITVCAPAKAKGSRTFGQKGVAGASYVTGGDKPFGVRTSNYG